MLTTAVDLAVGLSILGALVFTAIYILDHIGGGESYFQWRRERK